MKMRAIFYTSKWFDGHLVDNLISLWTWPYNIGTMPFSHMELWFPRENGGQFDCRVRCHYNDGGTMLEDEQEYHKTKYFGQCFTSTMRGDSKGCRFKPAGEVLKYPERWWYIEIEVTKGNYDMIWQFAYSTAEHNKGYDLKGLLGFVWPWATGGSPDKWYCSEVCVKLLAVANVMPLYPRISPRRASRRLIEQGHKLERLK